MKFYQVLTNGKYTTEPMSFEEIKSGFAAKGGDSNVLGIRQSRRVSNQHFLTMTTPKGMKHVVATLFENQEDQIAYLIEMGIL